MEILYQCCCGLDVHKKTVVAYLISQETDGNELREIRTFGTMSVELLSLLDWLLSAECTHVAPESTGSYWKPVYNLLEGAMKLLVVNAQHIKAVPGRKTDVKDAQWSAELLRHGLLKGSFIPSPNLRELRELVRYRKALIHERSSEVNRLQKVLEGANIKLASVVTNILGDMSRFPTHKHLAAWAGVTPGHHESAGKRHSGKTRKGNRWLRAALTEAAQSAGRSKTYLGTLYHRLAARRGAKRAAMAVAHAILVIVYHLLRDQTTYRDLGVNYFDQHEQEKVSRRLVKRLEKLGYKVSLEQLTVPSAT